LSIFSIFLFLYVFPTQCFCSWFLFVVAFTRIFDWHHLAVIHRYDIWG